MISDLYNYVADLIYTLLEADTLPRVGPVTPIPGDTPDTIPRIDPAELINGKHLANGGDAIVSSGRLNGTQVAVKTFFKAKKYSSELNIHQKLNHANIIQLYAHLNDTNNLTYLLILEFAIHGTLTDYLKTHEGEDRKNNLSAQYGIQIAEGVYYLHSKDIIHRDIKPDNLLITRDGTLKICDFSLSLHLEKHEDYRDEKKLKGSLGYLAPEIISFNPFNFWGIYRYDFKVDVYAVGVLLSLLVTSRENKCLFNHHKISVEVEKTASPELNRLIRFCLKDDPAQRPNMLTVLDHLRQPRIKFRPK